MGGVLIPEELLSGVSVEGVSRVHGGDIAAAFRVDTSEGPLFVKTHPRPGPDMFAREAAGLRALRRHVPGEVGVPRVVRELPSGLVLEWVEVGPVGGGDEEVLGRALAGLHRVSAPAFGAVDESLAGFVGSVPVDLTPSDSWLDFFVGRRLCPLVARAVDEGAVPARAGVLLERCLSRAEEWCGPVEPPALVHGDLWAGNRLVDVRGRHWLIDPACLWAHREVDLAMMRLFGGFGEGCFAAYGEVFPLAEGWQDRVAWYQLPPLLVHAILFGGGYGASVMAVLERYS
ncbi:Fructosamine-3-kinase [Austwickia chelonae]|uniref:Putative fructosamine-3-kinase n=1 Tax=Austwickia chelonae NBRC 105200 TaxID=1184607 RepID=K6UNN0_9MICO|nr:fructosamine kinase family protein [Austwickia chelonae]GAB79106.1 putative fructosamine-3-kinase [Austwickia chelonae NBRC 105200]SEW42301.1 Fructosamine-3-kinase [Austwickia chelonae]